MSRKVRALKALMDWMAIHTLMCTVQKHSNWRCSRRAFSTHFLLETSVSITTQPQHSHSVCVEA